MTDRSFQIKITRSPRRKKTISGKLVGDVLEIQAPAYMSDEDLKPYIETIIRRFERRKEKKQLSDEDLEKRAKQLNRKYFGGKLRWSAIRWSTRQKSVFGSCTPATGDIRISYRVAKMPDWVLDYVIVHELAHLLEANHSKRFWKLVNRYPLTERARGFLMASKMEEDKEVG